MPIKDFPNSDAELQQALQAAKLKADGTIATQLAFSTDTLTRLSTFLPDLDR